MPLLSKRASTRLPHRLHPAVPPRRPVRPGWPTALRRFGALLLAVSAMTGILPPSGSAAAETTRRPGCADVAELANGFQPLYSLNVPKQAQWNTASPVPYSTRAADYRRTLDRVAFCLETVDTAGRATRAYASFDAFGTSSTDYEIPVAGAPIARPVHGLTVEGDGLTPVTGAEGGSIEFWPNAYSKPSPTGAGAAAWDHSDTPTDGGYGSFQIHNASHGGTVMAINGWNTGSARTLDVGIGNRPTGDPDWTLSQSAASLRSAVLTAYVRPSTVAATTCESGVGELEDYTLLYEASVPATSRPWLDGVDYAVDARSRIDVPISRVAYCLEGSLPLTPRWTYASMDAWTQDLSRYRMPETNTTGARRTVTGLSTRSSIEQGKPLVSPVDGASGFLEMWPNAYSKEVIAGGPTGGRSDLWDHSDTQGAASSAYGSFQIHDVTNRQTVIALNGWKNPAATPLDVGMGSRRTAHPDWTLAKNRGEYGSLRLRVYVRPAGIDITEAPTDGRLYPRERDTDTAEIPVAGNVDLPGVVGTRLVVRREGTVIDEQESTGTEFSFRTEIVAERASHTVELWARRANGSFRLLRSATDVVAGDVYVVQGQSNAAAVLYPGSPDARSRADESPWIRTFGTPSFGSLVSVTDRSWYRAHGDSVHPDQPGYVGRLGLRLGHTMMERSGVPVAVMLGAHGGKNSGFFQRNDASPSDPATNYGRLLGRLEAAGLRTAVTAMVWYQGEADRMAFADPGAQHRANVEALLDDWAADLPALQQTYLVQIHAGCGTADPLPVQEVQRGFDSREDVTVVTSTGLDNHDGCHYGYGGGYRTLADWIALPMARDLLGLRPSTSASPPAPTAVTWADSSRTRISIALRDTATTLECDPGAVRDLRLGGTASAPTSVMCTRGRVLVELSAPGEPGTTISYLGHAGSATPTAPAVVAGAWLTNDSGMGLLSFGPLVVQ